MLTLLMILGACGDPAGARCELSSGALGFGFSDDCQGRCLALTTVTCPDNQELKRSICSGAEDCTPGSCGSAQACYAVPDPFETESFCVPADFCGAPLDDAALSTWEAQSHDIARAVREEWAAKRKLRVAKTSPSVVAPERVSPVPHTLVVPHPGGLAAVGCFEDGAMHPAADCVDRVPPGLEIALGGTLWRLGGPATLSCNTDGRALPGWKAEPLATDPSASARWGWIPSPPPGFQPPSAGPVTDPTLAASLPPHPARELTVASQADRDADGAPDPLVRAFYPSDDPDKPGRTILWSPGSNGPLLTGALSLNGVQDVVGEIPTADGTWLVLTSQWMGGSGVHLVAPPATAERSAEVACGS